MAKMCHQLLAGVHIAAAAEALSLAKAVGLDIKTFFELVCGAAGNSWIFSDRGKVRTQIELHIPQSSILLSIYDYKNI